MNFLACRCATSGGSRRQYKTMAGVVFGLVLIGYDRTQACRNVVASMFNSLPYLRLQSPQEEQSVKSARTYPIQSASDAVLSACELTSIDLSLHAEEARVHICVRERLAECLWELNLGSARAAAHSDTRPNASLARRSKHRQNHSCHWIY